MKRIFSTFAALTLAGCAWAQNSAIFKAEALVKESNYAGAIDLLSEAISNPKTTKQAEMYRTMGECHYQLFNMEFIKGAQNASFDTLSFYNHLDAAVDCFTKSYEADNAPDEKGRVKAKLNEKNNAVMKNMLEYYWYAAIFAAKQNDSKLSRDYFVKYLDFPRNVVFGTETDSIYARNPTYAKAAYFAAVQSNEIKDWEGTLKYTAEALKDTANLLDLYRLRLNALQECVYDSVKYSKEQRDAYDAQFGETLAEAVSRTGNEGLMGSMVTYYMQKQDRENAVAKSNELLANDPQNPRLYYIKGVIEMNMPPYNYEEARKNFEKAIELKPDYYAAYKNLGASYINDIEERVNRNEFNLPTGNTEAQVKEYRRIMREKVYPHYNAAKDIYEKLRELAPDQPDLWAEGLYAVYSRLLMQEQAAEIKQFLPNAQ